MIYFDCKIKALNNTFGDISLKGTTKNKGQKDALDRFYTKPDVASRLVQELIEHYPQMQDAIFIEPSAGDGAFVYALESDARIPNENIIALDIAPSESSICQSPIHRNDFLEDNLADKLSEKGFDDSLLRNTDKVVFIGNPPFGEQATLATAFVKKSLENARWCAFILPPSFRKESMQKKLANFGALDSLIELDDTSYRMNGEILDVPSYFFVFDAKKEFEETPDMTDELPFHKVTNDPKKRESADFAIRRVGGTAGSATENVTECSKETYYFFAKDNGCPDDIVDIINECDFPERDWSVGPRSLSVKEMSGRIYEEMLRRGLLAR